MSIWKSRRKCDRRRTKGGKQRNGLSLEELELRQMLAAADILQHWASLGPTQFGPELIQQIDSSGEEEGKAQPPANVAGAFLTYTAPTDGRGMAFNDVQQGASDTCAFSAALAAVAITNFDIESGIEELSTNGGVTTYRVRFYEPDTLNEVWVNVEFDGIVQPADLRPADEDEFWAAIYLRGYLQFSAALEANYHSMRHAFRSLTGEDTELFVPDGSRASAQHIEAALNAGRPMSAGTIDDEPRILDGSAGIVHDHAYTILAIQVPSSGTAGITLTLRNPWGVDTVESVFDADGSGDLSFDEWAAYYAGLNGHNDGIIQISWDQFVTYFDHVAISGLTGPSINGLISQPPVFEPLADDFLRVSEGERLIVDFNAVDPDGKAVFYSIDTVEKFFDDSFDPRDWDVYQAPYIQLQSGQFSWEPLAGDAGAYRIAITAYTSPLDYATYSIAVGVRTGAPLIGSLTANPTSIKDDGTDLLTLTANDVVSDVDEVDHVEFYRDANGNGTFEEGIDAWITRDENGSDGWSWSGFVGGLTPGSQTFFARAGRYSFSDLHWSAAAAVSVTVTAAPVVQPAAIALGNQQTASPTTSFDRFGYALTSDAAGNFYVFWNGDGDTFMRKYNAAGVAQGAAVPLLQNASFADVAMLANGSFAAVYFSGSNLKVQRFTSSGAIQGSSITAATGGGSRAKVASDSNGNLLIVYDKGGFLAEDVYAVSVSTAGTVTRASWRVNTQTSGSQKFPTVALNGSGEGVIAWTDFIDFSQKQTIARRVSNYGLSNGAEFTVADEAEADLPLSSAINSSGEFLIAWQTFESGSTRYDVRARRYGSDGQPQTAPFRVNSFRGDDQWFPKVAMNDAGWAIFGWRSDAQDTGDGVGDGGVYAQLYDPQGNPAGPEFQVPTSVAGTQSLAGLLIDADADITFAWTHGAGSADPGFASVAYRRFAVNLAPTFAASNDFTLPENSPAGTTVGTVQATDPDSGDTLTYALVGDSPFLINAQTGQLSVANPSLLDFEERTQFVLAVRVSDNGNPAQSTLGTVTVNVADVNEAPQVEAETFSLPEHSQWGTIVGRVQAVDAEGSRLTYSLIGNSPFAIDPLRGEISVMDPAAVNFENATGLTVQVQATDLGSPAASGVATITIALTDIDEQHLIAAADAGVEPRVRVLDPETLEDRFDLLAYHPGFRSGVRVAAGDVNRDGVADIITAPGPGGGPHIRVFDGQTGQPLSGPIGSFFAYHPNFNGGVFVASGDVNGDGWDDVITGAGAGGGPHVKVFSGRDGTELFGFFAYHPNFGGGVHVAAGDVDDDGRADIVTGAGFGGGPHVKIVSGRNQTELFGFFAYHPNFNGGVYVAAGDVDGDQHADIYTGAGFGGGPHVRVVSGADQTDLHSFFAYHPNFSGGVRVGAGDLDGDGLADIITAAGPGGGPHVRGISGADGADVNGFFAYDPAFSGGVFVAGGGVDAAGAALRIAGGTPIAASADPMTSAQLEAIRVAAIRRWVDVGFTSEGLDALQHVRVGLADLPGDLLGLVRGAEMLIDRDAAGRGWFVDATPQSDEEFSLPAGHAVARAAIDRVDLLTVVLHELGHVLGLQHEDQAGPADALLLGELGLGLRRLPTPRFLDDLFAQW